ncbi:hypothetical protein EVAR_50335_1 [Eumeta japonica]|uniref:Uncharacterized protein n=1 Tax=Eumeta variegata TaxID=151549 RepID=A0A4C1XRM4_EUMVA|nr:hypothetical protein EVAR_50335_1 [Eumeta japonica]
MKVKIAAKQHTGSSDKDWRKNSKQSNRILEKDNTQIEVHTKQDTTALLQLINERLEMMTSELKVLRNKKPSPPVQNLATELTQVQIKSNVTYTTKAAAPPNLRPNHTLIVSSVDPKNTGEQAGH